VFIFSAHYLQVPCMLSVLFVEAKVAAISEFREFLPLVQRGVIIVINNMCYHELEVLKQ
jgi:hypothetical protein